MNKKYKVKSPVVVFFYNRPDNVKTLCNQLKLVEFTKLTVFFDGYRSNKEGDLSKVTEARRTFSDYEWDCDVDFHYSDQNRGCKGSILYGVNSILKEEETVIVLEDDCNPTPEFFKFCDWGLEQFKSHNNVGMVCGSNLVADKHPINYCNGFSKIFSPWGWATWRDKWEMIDFDLTVLQANSENGRYSIGNDSEIGERLYWNGVFKHAILSGSIWALILQQQIFSKCLLVLYPSKNLIHNTGYGTEATHTSGAVPSFVTKNAPNDETSVLNQPENHLVSTSVLRDRTLIRTVWRYSLITSIRITLGNFKRYGL